VHKAGQPDATLNIFAVIFELRKSRDFIPGYDRATLDAHDLKVLIGDPNFTFEWMVTFLSFRNVFLIGWLDVEQVNVQLVKFSGGSRT
jgi:hypothetical protein